jgi:glycosyltransferase involved in cell wall biosynthesis
MQYSLPIVTTYEGGLPDMVENGVTGFLVPQHNTEALAEKLEILIQNPMIRLQMGNVGYQKYENKYTLEIFEKRIVEIFDKILKIRD